MQSNNRSVLSKSKKRTASLPQRAKAVAAKNLPNPVAQSLVMFLVFLCSMMSLSFFAVGMGAALILHNMPVAGTFFTLTTGSLGLAYKLVRLMTG